LHLLLLGIALGLQTMQLLSIDIRSDVIDKQQRDRQEQNASSGHHSLKSASFDAEAPDPVGALRDNENGELLGGQNDPPVKTNKKKQILERTFKLIKDRVFICQVF
jgi:hypothetical protein